MRRGALGAALAVVSLTACTPDAVNAPDDDAAPVPMTASAEQRAASSGTIADVASRIVARSEHLAASADLTDAIDAVNRAIDRADARALQLALRRADSALARLSKTDADDAAELDAVRLALADAHRLLTASDAEAPRT